MRDFRSVFNIIGMLLCIEAVAMLIPMIIAGVLRKGVLGILSFCEVFGSMSTTNINQTSRFLSVGVFQEGVHGWFRVNVDSFQEQEGFR